MIATIRCDATAAWQALREHHTSAGRAFDLRTAFASDAGRYEAFALEAPEAFADLSKNLWDSRTRDLLLELAHQCGVAREVRAVGFEARRGNCCGVLGATFRGGVERYAVQHQAAHARGMSLCERQRHARAGVVAGDHGGGDPERVEHAGEVVGVVLQRGRSVRRR